MDNLNIMCEAKKEYMGQLYLIMCPPMIEVFQDMYDEATKLSKGRKTLIMFQKLLKEVPNWSNAMSKQHSDNIANRCAWFNDLLAAVFVASTKILSAVRLKADNRKISLKLPSNEVFIQTCYNNVAKDLYKDPYVFHEEQSEYARDEDLTRRFSVCIEATVKELIPVQEILQTYMSQTAEMRDIDLDGEVHDTVDPDVFDDPMEPEPTEPLPEDEPMMGAEEEPIQPTGLENEFKTVPGVQDPAPEPVTHEMPEEPQMHMEDPEEDDGVFFGDAPEQRVKKTAYN
jgi:hypothetical protein